MIFKFILPLVLAFFAWILWTDLSDNTSDSRLASNLTYNQTTNTSQTLEMTKVDEWRAALESLPSVDETGRIPAFFFGHGSPMLLAPPQSLTGFPSTTMSGTNSDLANFLRDFGPTILKKYRPKAILVFSAHWETRNEILVTNYGEENPLLMDYYGFGKEHYEVEFVSKGSETFSNTVVEELKKAGISARTSPKTETRGSDGRGFDGPGLDHGVFVPFKFMFGDRFQGVPIIQASIDGTLDPERNFKLGKAVEGLRSQGVLILSGGVLVHNLRDFSSFGEGTAKASVKAFEKSIYPAVDIQDAKERQKKMYGLVLHPGFRQAHPREEHFVPLYIAAGAGETGTVKVLNQIYACPTFAFGI